MLIIILSLQDNVYNMIDAIRSIAVLTDFTARRYTSVALGISSNRR